MSSKSSKFLNHGSKVAAVRAACDRLGLRSKLAAVQREAAIILKAWAIAEREKTIKLQNIEIEAYTPLLKKYKNDVDLRSKLERNLKWANNSIESAKTALKEIQEPAHPSEWIDYQQTCLVRKQIQREKNQVADCRSYTGQPARDMRI